eukprot:m.187559 g.187559  ORF g.187559 m.187559 type:complete len:62 (+) comp16930_c0_seq2:3847-4032(+)
MHAATTMRLSTAVIVAESQGKTQLQAARYKQNHVHEHCENQALPHAFNYRNFTRMEPTKLP